MSQSVQSLQYKRKSWFRSVLRLTGTVIPEVMPRCLGFGGLGILVSILHQHGMPVAQPILGSIIPSLVLGLLLVFRTNTAYDRFWEGRKAWGSTVNTLRNLTWQIWVAVKEREPSDRDRKIAAERLLIAFAIAKKNYLRGEPVSPEMAPFVSPEQYKILQNSTNMPLQISSWLGDYLQQEYEENCLNAHQLTLIQGLLNCLIDNLGICERILKTPIPMAYSVHLNQLIFIDCLLLPFQFVSELLWLTSPFVALMSFAFFGIEEIAVEIEQPFGYDNNDLPLDVICEGIHQTVEEYIQNHSLADLGSSR